MRLTRKKFRKWVNWVDVNNCNGVIYRLKACYAKAIALNEYTLEAKLAKQKEAESFWNTLSMDKKSDIAVMMMEVIAEEKRKNRMGECE